MRICVIPARGGSKRIPRKNIRKFGGKPIIAWSIEAAQESQCFDKVIVSTEDLEIAAVSAHWGAESPFTRPADLADDLAGTMPVVAHTVKWYLGQGIEPSAVCCLYATAPFVEPKDIRRGYEMLADVDRDNFVFTATSYSSPIQRALRLDPESGKAQMWQAEKFNIRSQDLEPAFHDASQFYWGRAQAWLHSENLFEGSSPLIIPRWRVQDIDTEDDWVQAELMHKALSGGHFSNKEQYS